MHIADRAGICKLAVDALERADGSVGLRLEFDVVLYPPKLMGRFWNNFLVFLVQIINGCQARIPK